MKFCVILFLLSLQSALGQDDPLKARWGVKAGVNYSYMDFSKGSLTPEIPVQTSWNSGFHAGVVVIVPITQKFFFQPEYLFSYITSDIRPTQSVFHLSYLSMPVLLRVETGDRLSFVAGPQFGLLINAEEEELTRSNLTKEIENRSIQSAVGIEYKLTHLFSIHMRYVKGYNHIGIRYQDINRDFRFEMIQSSLIFTF